MARPLLGAPIAPPLLHGMCHSLGIGCAPCTIRATDAARVTPGEYRPHPWGWGLIHTHSSVLSPVRVLQCACNLRP